ncbi:hypothetical protein F7725_015849 [Dissostichus mawsoni]|uniref:Uncharacterized protein n=1 Tax=Dissostichus mawsoni TaxID=36200 RepID=A0A7J5YIQ0_DISMA|nr:hypothetical protein F7725_015849 [Dissostichus mawsoni]
MAMDDADKDNDKRDTSKSSQLHRGTCPSTASGADPYPLLSHPADPQLDLRALVSLETDSGGEEGCEETIVYL